MTLEEYWIILRDRVKEIKSITHVFGVYEGAYMDGKEEAFEAVLEELKEVKE